MLEKVTKFRVCGFTISKAIKLPTASSFLFSLSDKKILIQSLVRYLGRPEMNPTCITWCCKEDGIFRIVDSAAVAKEWGKEKGNDSMTYEKLSRALRHYYKAGLLERYIPEKRRLWYKLSKSAMHLLLKK